MENVMKVNIRDRNFDHVPYSSLYNECKYFEWYRKLDKVSKSCFFTDKCLLEIYRTSKSEINVAWILEPRSILPYVYEWIKKIIICLIMF